MDQGLLFLTVRWLLNKVLRGNVLRVLYRSLELVWELRYLLVNWLGDRHELRLLGVRNWLRLLGVCNWLRLLTVGNRLGCNENWLLVLWLVINWSGEVLLFGGLLFLVVLDWLAILYSVLRRLVRYLVFGVR